MSNTRKTNKTLEVVAVTAAGITAVAALFAAMLGQGGMSAFLTNGSSKGGANPSSNAEKTHEVIADRDFTQNNSGNNGNSINTSATGGNVENHPVNKGGNSNVQITIPPQEPPSTINPQQTSVGDGNTQIQGNGNTTTTNVNK